MLRFGWGQWDPYDQRLDQANPSIPATWPISRAYTLLTNGLEVAAVMHKSFNKWLNIVFVVTDIVTITMGLVR